MASICVNIRINLSTGKADQQTIMQIVYISNRPEVLRETLKQVALFMPFIDRALVLVPDALAARFNIESPRVPLTVIAESTILTKVEMALLPKLDHQRRNYLLRSNLIAHNQVDDQFIMSDDDSRALKTVEVASFVEGEKHHRYYFYDLAEWPSSQTEFDAGQHSTFALLQYHNLPHLSYASHMPQIIDKQLFLAAVEFFKDFKQDHPICEWSSYFNYAGTHHPGRFYEPRPYLTLCWPEHPLAWRQQVKQTEYLFENFTPNCYQNSGQFADIACDPSDPTSTAKANVEKISRWQKHRILSVHPEQKRGLAKFLKLRTWINKLASPLG